MLGAIYGDAVGSVYEFANTSDYNFKMTRGMHLTDDSVCTLAVANTLFYGTPIVESLLDFCHSFSASKAGFGGRFGWWLRSPDRRPYGSFGNGAAMRVSPVGWAAATEDECKAMARAVTECTHNHPEGVKGAEAIALAIFRLRTVSGEERKRDIVDEILRVYYPKFSERDKEACRGVFDETCQRTVPTALLIFRASKSFEDAVRLAVSFGGDSDTLGAIVGGMAEAFYGMTAEQRRFALAKTAAEHEEWARLVEQFEERHGVRLAM